LEPYKILSALKQLPDKSNFFSGIASNAGTAMTTACPTKKILIIEDHDFERETFAAILAGAGFRTEQAGDARQAMQSLMAEKPDLILLDMLLPGADGKSLARRSSPGPAMGTIIDH
jgi:PleD family two-component response regulator